MAPGRLVAPLRVHPEADPGRIRDRSGERELPRTTAAEDLGLLGEEGRIEAVLDLQIPQRAGFGVGEAEEAAVLIGVDQRPVFAPRPPCRGVRRTDPARAPLSVEPRDPELVPYEEGDP